MVMCGFKHQLTNKMTCGFSCPAVALLSGRISAVGLPAVVLSAVPLPMGHLFFFFFFFFFGLVSRKVACTGRGFCCVYICDCA